MINLLKSLIFTILLITPTLVFSEQLGRYVSIEQIEISDTITVPAGAEVNFLGVIDVTLSTVPSGKLATFTYKNQVLNADAALFYAQTNDQSIFVYPPRTFDSGNTASVCSTFATRVNGKTLDFADDSFQNYFEITTNNKMVDAFSVTRPSDIYSRDDKRSEFCITGLTHSTLYEVRILPNLKLSRYGLSAQTITAAINIAFKTPERSPSIKLDASKTIMVDPSNAVMPIEYVNVSEIEVTLHQVDSASLTSYSDILKILDGQDITRLKDYWGDEVAKKTIILDAPLNKQQELNLDFSDILTNDASGLFVATFASPQIELDDYTNRPTQWFSISNVALQFYKGLNKSDILLNTFDDTTAISDANVHIIAANNRTLFEGSSDSNGRVEVPNRLIDGTKGFAPKFLIVSTKNNGSSIIELNALDQKPRFLNGGTEKRANMDIYLTTDRGVYRPGEKLHFVGAARDLSLEPLSEQELTVRLINSASSEIYKSLVTSNEFGAFAKQIDLKKTLPLGLYSLQVLAMDEVLLAKHEVSISDFVPLTIEAKLDTGGKYWSTGEQQQLILQGSYYSGGPAAGLSAEIATFLEEVSIHNSNELAEFVFGNSAISSTKEMDSFERKLDQNGELSASILSDYSFNTQSLYDVVIEGTIYDVGGRANKVKQRVAIDTLPSYVGVRPNFEDYASEDFPPSFTIASVDRKGTGTDYEAISYSVQKVYSTYNWYYDNGWRWNAVRVSDEVVESGTITNKNLTLKTRLSWGRHELTVTNQFGFETVYEFYVGWGANAKPATEPEQLSVSFDGKILRGNAPFGGKLSVLVANEDIQSVFETKVQQGAFEMPFETSRQAEPGFHLLTSLVRPIAEGSEHLPQIAIGKTWVSNAKTKRELSISVKTASTITSQDVIDIAIDTNATDGNAMIFVVDEGIHAISGYKNKSIQDHFLDERALNFGIFTNFGKLISRDKSLKSIRVGGDEGMLSAAAKAPKSEFFKTFVAASPLLKISDGKASYQFEETNEWEGRLRVVVITLDDMGFGFSESEIIVQDPVSIDVSMPRFVAPNDFVNAKMNVRWNEFVGSIDIKTKIGEATTTQTVSQPNSNQFSVDLPINVKSTGPVSINIEIVADERVYSRSYELVSRHASYPVSEVQSVEIKKQNWLGIGSSLVQPYNSSIVDMAKPGITTTASLTNTIGINLSQLVSELNNYPYGCVEQVSSKARGLMAMAELRGMDTETSQKIQIGIDNLVAKQKTSGAFGYWSKNSRVYEVYQPYAIDTLQKLLPYADNQNVVIDAINNGLEFLYRTNFDEQRTKLYTYGILARSGFEVTSRARYAIDVELAETRPALADVNVTSLVLSNALEDFVLAYWVAANLNDTKRMLLLAERIQFLLDKNSSEQTATNRTAGAWFTTHSNGYSYDQLGVSAPDTAHLLAELNEDLLAPALTTVIANTNQYLSQRSYRSTRSSAKLVALQQFQDTSLAGTAITIDGIDMVLDQTGKLPLTNQQLQFGFEIGHNAKTPLFLNVKTTGQRRYSAPINNGYKVSKWWFDRSGALVLLDDGVLSAGQGQLFTVVVEIDRTKRGSGSDILLTDLLPTGFEIEDATLSDPRIDGVKINVNEGRSPYFTAKMDDRLIAHFDDKWFRGSAAFVKYTVRAAYQGMVQIPDATVEEMYSPETNGRSDIRRSVVLPR